MELTTKRAYSNIAYKDMTKEVVMSNGVIRTKMVMGK